MNWPGYAFRSYFGKTERPRLSDPIMQEEALSGKSEGRVCLTLGCAFVEFELGIFSLGPLKN